MQPSLYYNACDVRFIVTHALLIILTDLILDQLVEVEDETIRLASFLSIASDQKDVLAPI